MWVTERIKNNIGTSIIITFVLFCIIFSYFGNKKYKEDTLRDYNAGFTGVIIKKYRQKGGDIIFYKNLKTMKEYEINPSEELAENSNVGDTIIKFPQSNKCILKNRGKNIKVQCHFIE